MNKKIVVLGIAAVLLAIVVMLRMNATEERGDVSSTEVTSRSTDAEQSTEVESDEFSFDRKQVAKLARSKAPKAPRRAIKPRVRSIIRTADESFPRLLEQAEAETDAAPVYQMVFDRMDASPAKETFSAIDELMGKGEGTWSERYLNMDDGDKETLLQLLRSPEISEITALMHEAAAKESCDFQLDYSQGFSLLLPHLSPMRRMARLSTLQALAYSDWDDAEAALGAAEVGLVVGRDSAADKLLISGLVGIAADRTMLESLVGLAQQPDLPADRAYSVLVEMAKRDYVTDMGASIELEAGMAAKLVDDLTRDPGSVVHLLGEDLPPEVKSQLGDKDFAARSIEKMAAVSARYVEISKLPPSEIREAVAAMDEEMKTALSQPDAFFASQLMPTYGKIILKAQNAVDELDAVYVDVVTAIYRSQHGRDPQSLEDLEAIIQQARAYESESH